MKKKVIFSGTATALVTPFHRGRVDYNSLGLMIDFQISEGIDALVVLGTTGEVLSLSEYERYKIYDFAAERTAGRVPLILGTGSADTRLAKKYTKRAYNAGADAALVVTPYYNKGTNAGISKHYLSVANCSDLPIIVYNVPSRTGVNLPYSIINELASHENIVGLKEATSSAERLMELSELYGKFPIYSGNDNQIILNLALGGRGVISVLSNALPREVSDITRAYFSGLCELAREKQRELLPLALSIFAETNPSPIKYLLSYLGHCSASLRLPLAQPTDAVKLWIIKEYEAYLAGRG